MRTLRQWQAALALCASLVFSPSQAVLISADDPVFGAGAITIDTETGLQWLDVTLTTGMSMNAVAAALAGGALDGWAFATADQVTELWNNAGVPLPVTAPGFPEFVFGSAGNTAALALNALLGTQVNSPEFNSSRGFILELSTVSPRWWQIDASLVAGGVGSTSASFLIATFDTPSPTIGSYLVRITRALPEPGSVLTLLTVALAMTAALLSQRRRAAKRARRQAPRRPLTAPPAARRSSASCP
jgi:hypothetical protein